MPEENKKVAFKDTMAGPTVILFLICLVVSGLLALTYQVTLPTTLSNRQRELLQQMRVG